MKARKLRDYILNDDRDLRDRLFVLMTAVLLVSCCISLIVHIIAGTTLHGVLIPAVSILMLGGITMLATRSNHIRLGAIIVSADVCVIYAPIMFLFSGGISGEAPLWFLFGVFFVNICLGGKIKYVFLLIELVEAIICWYVSFRYPELITVNSSMRAHTFSLLAFILIGASMSVMIGFRNAYFKREMQRSLAQQKEIEALNRAQNHFFSSMSHEIRTPINTIIALNEMILRENISDEVAEDAANIQSASNMLLHLINDILDMSRFASGQIKLSPTVYHPGDMLSEIVGMLWIRAKEKNLDFQINVSPDIPAELQGDEIRIKQILINVLNNAIKYTKQGSVSLSIQPGETENGMLNVIYTVSDTGIGIKKENIPYLFNAFKRVDEEQNRHIEGTGLGLAIVKQFVDLMGGRITVNSIYTKGSTFIIEIPQKIVGTQHIGEIRLENMQNVGKRTEHISHFEAPEANVLVVDDNASNLLVVSKLLRDTKVKVVTAPSGAEALKHTLNEYYHVIFMDHLMPHMDGIECLKAIRSHIGGRCKESKIVALTANAGSENQQLYAREGFDGYLPKPITGNILERELYRLLPRELTYVTGSDENILQDTISWMKQEQRKKNVIITTESVADLPQEIIDRYGIAVLPHLVVTPEGSFMDGVEIETRGLLEYMNDHSCRVVTRSPDVATIEAFFAKQLTLANNIIHISISSTLANSGCPVAEEAAKAFDNVTVIDSGHLSSGQGLMVIEACRLAEEGKSPDEIKARLAHVQQMIHTSFVVDSLDYLARADQVSAKVASVTKSLMVKPVLTLKHGKMGVGRVYIGSRTRAWKRYIRSVLRHPSHIDRRILFVTYVGIKQREMEWIRKQVEDCMDFDRIYFQKASPVIAVNCGDGTFGLLIRDADAETNMI